MDKMVLDAIREVDRSIYLLTNVLCMKIDNVEDVLNQVERITKKSIDITKETKIKRKKPSVKITKEEIYSLLKEWGVDQEEVKKHEGLQNIIKNAD